jgi:hypothetical protein
MRNRIAILVCVALPLAGLDLLVKSALPTDPFLFHQRSGTWMVSSTVLLCFLLLLARLPSRLLATSAGVLAAGVLGNLVSAGLHRGLVPNPFVVDNGDFEIAFNLADLFVLGDIVLLIAAGLRTAVRYRHRLPQSTVTMRLFRRVRALLASS